MDFICENVCESSLCFPPPPAFNFVSLPNIWKERICFFTSCTHMYQQLIKDGTGQSQKILDSCRYNLLLIRRWRNIQQHLFSKDGIRQLPITSARIWVLTSPTELRWAEGFPGVLSSLQNQSFSVGLHEQSSVLTSNNEGDRAIKQSLLNKIWVKSSAFSLLQTLCCDVLMQGTSFRLRRAPWAPNLDTRKSRSFSSQSSSPLIRRLHVLGAAARSLGAGKHAANFLLIKPLLQLWVLRSCLQSP